MDAKQKPYANLDAPAADYAHFDAAYDDYEEAAAVDHPLLPSGNETREADKHKKRFREKIESEEEVEDADHVIIRFEEKRRRVKRGRQSSSESDDESARDQRERKYLERNISEHDDRRELMKQEMEEEEEEEAVRRSKASERGDINSLRKASRQKYLRNREQKKLEELRDDIEDEQYLFDGVKLPEEENRRLRYKREILELSKKGSELEADDDIGEYKIPEAYDHEGMVDQEKRFAVSRQRYRGYAAGDELNPQETWETHQVGKATWTSGSKNKKQMADNYQFVFENPIEFSGSSVVDDGSKAKSALTEFQNLKKGRISLPIYKYRDELIQAVQKYQVLIIEGDTGSGKTTQIPQYLHEAGFTKLGKIGCTEPRRVAAVSVASRVSREMGVRLGDEVGYSIRFEDRTSKKTILKYMTDGMLLRELRIDPSLASYSVIMVDEAHERTVSTDILLGLVKDIARSRPNLKILISSATLDAEKFSHFFDSAHIFKIPGRCHHVEIHHAKAPEPNYLEAAIETVLRTHVLEPPGDILVFLTGQEEIETAGEDLKHRIRGFGKKIAQLIICPIYANLPTQLQAKIFEPTPEGARKVILATNIAEASVTINGIKYVIDSGYCKTKTYNPRTGMESLQVTPISKASAIQRAGRSGRTGPGKCFRLYTNFSYQNELDDSTPPEMLRTNLASVFLTLKSLGLGADDIAKFDFMDKPPPEAQLKALQLLYALGALNHHGELTKSGRQMAEFPLDPMLSKMIVSSDKYQCSDEVISIAAMLSVGNSIFYRPKNKQVHADNAKMNFHIGNAGDHIALMKVYNSWVEENFSSQWCYDNFIQNKSMNRARDIRDQLKGLLDRVGIQLQSSRNDLVAIKKAIASGFFPHLARLQKHRLYQTVKQPQTVCIHPSSGMAEAEVLPRWVIYHELVLTTKEYMRQVTEVKPEWLLEIAPHYYQTKDVEDAGTKKMPKGKGGAQDQP